MGIPGEEGVWAEGPREGAGLGCLRNSKEPSVVGARGKCVSRGVFGNGETCSSLHTRPRGKRMKRGGTDANHIPNWGPVL